MKNQLLAKGILVLWIGVGLLPLSMFLGEEMRTSIGGKPTGERFVSPGSDASKRGYALPGEGQAANLVTAQFDRAAKVQVAAGAGIAAGVVMIAIALIPGSAVPTTGMSSGAILGKILSGAFGALIFGGIGGVALIGVLKVVPDIVFNILGLVVLVAVGIFIKFKDINPGKLLT